MGGDNGLPDSTLEKDGSGPDIHVEHRTPKPRRDPQMLTQILQDMQGEAVVTFGPVYGKTRDLDPRQAGEGEPH